MSQDEGCFNEPSLFLAVLPAAVFHLAERAASEAELWRSDEPFQALLFTPYIMGMGKVPLAIAIARLGLLIAAEGLFHATSSVSPGAPRAVSECLLPHHPPSMSAHTPPGFAATCLHQEVQDPCKNHSGHPIFVI